MEDIFSASREGSVKFVRTFLENIENDLNEGWATISIICFLKFCYLYSNPTIILVSLDIYIKKRGFSQNKFLVIFAFVMTFTLLLWLISFYFYFSDDHGFTPLHWACREGQMVVFEMLMVRGAKHSARNDGGDTPLHLAAAHGNKDIVIKVMPLYF